MAAAAAQLVRAVVAERADGRRVREPDEIVRIDDPDRLRRRVEDGDEEILRCDAPLRSSTVPLASSACGEPRASRSARSAPTATWPSRGSAETTASACTRFEP
jgi:hypothetical protein